MVELQVGHSGTFTCENCNTSLSPPHHCGKNMLYDKETTSWLCWKGEHQPCCGKESRIQITCCDSPRPKPE